MSQVYSTEPETTGRVVVVTTHGPLEIDLWCKECPTTTRAFLQLCLDGYYDGMIFHRIFADFLIQTGLTRNDSLRGRASATEIDGYLRRSTAVPSPANGASGLGDALGLDRKKLELNPRIRFNHRGQVAMAVPLEESAENKVDKEDLAYQFFVTLAEAPFLDAKHVVFGTISGSTMFNALRIGRTDVDEQSGIPIDMKDCPPRILRIEVGSHPFEDMVITADKKVPWNKATETGAGGEAEKGEETKVERRRKKRKGKRDLNVLSFGNEEREYDDIAQKSSGKGSAMLSSHEVLSRDSSGRPSKADAAVNSRSQEKPGAKTEPERRINNDEERKAYSDVESPSKIELKDDSNKQHPTDPNVEMVSNDSRSNHNRSQEDQHQNCEIKNKDKPKAVSAVEARRAKYLRSGRGSSAGKKSLIREGDTMAKLFAFKSKVVQTKGSKMGDDKNGHAEKDNALASRMAKRVKRMEDEQHRRDKDDEAFAATPGYTGQVDEDEKLNGDNDAAAYWMGTKFKCKRHMDHDSRETAMNKTGGGAYEVGGDGRRMDDYVVLDEKRSGRHNNDRRRDGRETRHHRDSRKHGGSSHNRRHR